MVIENPSQNITDDVIVQFIRYHPNIIEYYYNTIANNNYTRILQCKYKTTIAKLCMHKQVAIRNRHSNQEIL
jgi:hypothetical protein